MVQKVIQNQQQIPPWHQLRRAAFINQQTKGCCTRDFSPKLKWEAKIAEKE